MKILLLLTAVQRAACILVNHAFRQGCGKRKGVGSCLKRVGKWFEMILDLGAGRKMFWGGVVSWTPSKSCQICFDISQIRGSIVHLCCIAQH